LSEIQLDTRAGESNACQSSEEKRTYAAGELQRLLYLRLQSYV